MGTLLSEDKPIADVRQRRDGVDHHSDAFHAHADYDYLPRHAAAKLFSWLLRRHCRTEWLCMGR